MVEWQLSNSKAARHTRSNIRAKILALGISDQKYCAPEELPFSSRATRSSTRRFSACQSGLTAVSKRKRSPRTDYRCTVKKSQDIEYSLSNCRLISSISLSRYISRSVDGARLAFSSSILACLVFTTSSNLIIDCRIQLISLRSLRLWTARVWLPDEPDRKSVV